MQVDGELYHVVCRNTFPLYWMGQARVWQVERTVEFSFRQRGIGRIDYYRQLAALLQDAGCCIFVAFLLDMTEVGSFFLFIFQTFFMGKEGDIPFLYHYFLVKVNHLGNIGDELFEAWGVHLCLLRFSLSASSTTGFSPIP
mgnify:FL=1